MSAVTTCECGAMVRLPRFYPYAALMRHKDTKKHQEAMRPPAPAEEKPTLATEEPKKCVACGTPTEHATGIGDFCPNKTCERLDDPYLPAPAPTTEEK